MACRWSLVAGECVSHQLSGSTLTANRSAAAAWTTGERWAWCALQVQLHRYQDMLLLSDIRHHTPNSCTCMDHRWAEACHAMLCRCSCTFAYDGCAVHQLSGST